MSLDLKCESVQLIKKRLNTCYSNLLLLITSFEKGSTAEITTQLRSVATDLQGLREAVRDIPNISSEEAYQFAKIRDLYRQLELKDGLIHTFGTTVIHTSSGIIKLLLNHINQAEDSQNSQAIEFGIQYQWIFHCHNSEKECISGFWAIRDMMAFENVGFTHAVDGIKYLTCAECEFGPIGFVDGESGVHFIAPTRLSYKI